MIVYELHVRGFTAGGTFSDLIEKIPYIKSLGVTAVELLPITHFDSTHNFWGYSPLDFFRTAEHFGPDFLAFVDELHKQDLLCILDLVYNHTDPACDLPPSYYSGRNDSGCGNTLDTTNPEVVDLILRSLRHFDCVDGFRFDLASILLPCLDQIAEAFPDHILIAEPWDAAGAYDLGKFPEPWLEWNGSFRDTIRDYLRGNHSLASLFATRMAGSSDLYRSPMRSVNFITCHDGFTLADLTSYNTKHNEANGENNRDGSDHNLSWNCGHEGPTSDPQILALRDRQMQNFLTALLTSQGVPMLQAGDECAHTKQGNNNTWNQDNALNYIDHANPIYADLIRKLIALRPLPSPTQLKWLTPEGTPPDWSEPVPAIALHYPGLYIAFNPTPESRPLKLPSGSWQPYIGHLSDHIEPWSSLVCLK